MTGTHCHSFLVRAVVASSGRSARSGAGTATPRSFEATDGRGRSTPRWRHDRYRWDKLAKMVVPGVLGGVGRGTVAFAKNSDAYARAGSDLGPGFRGYGLHTVVASVICCPTAAMLPRHVARRPQAAGGGALADDGRRLRLPADLRVVRLPPARGQRRIRTGGRRSAWRGACGAARCPRPVGTERQRPWPAPPCQGRS